MADGTGIGQFGESTGDVEQLPACVRTSCQEPPKASLSSSPPGSRQRPGVRAWRDQERGEGVGAERLAVSETISPRERLMPQRTRLRAKRCALRRRTPAVRLGPGRAFASCTMNRTRGRARRWRSTRRVAAEADDDVDAAGAHVLAHLGDRPVGTWPPYRGGRGSGARGKGTLSTKSSSYPRVGTRHARALARYEHEHRGLGLTLRTLRRRGEGFT